MTPTPTQKKSLATIYQSMPTEDIKRRIAGGDLTLAALEAAQQELERRPGQASIPAQSVHAPQSSQSAGPAQPTRPRLPANQRIGLWLLVASCPVFIAFAYFAMRDQLVIVLLIEISVLAAVFGKLLSRLGLAIGWLLVLTPVWMAIWFGSLGLLKMQHGDLAPLGTLLVYILLFVISTIGIAAGMAMIRGARSTKPWGHFVDDLESERDSDRDAGLPRLRGPGRPQ